MKRLISLLMAAMMLLMLVPVTAVAAGFTVALEPNAQNVSPGDGVEVMLSAVDVPEFAGFQVIVTYDADVLEPVQGSWQEWNGKKFVTATGDYHQGYNLDGSMVYNKETSGEVSLVYSDTVNTVWDLEEPVDTELVTIYFQVKGTAANGNTTLAISTVPGTEKWVATNSTLTSPTYVPCTLTVTGAAEHTHELTKHEANDATCDTAGNKAYYSCDCGLYFSDADGTQEIEENSWVLSELNHDGTLTKTEAKDATCQEAGNVAYFHCSACDKYFAVGTGNTPGEEKTREALTIAKNENAHDFATEWSQSETQHWHVCQNNGCEEKGSAADHSWVVKVNSGTDTGHKVVCSVCDYEKGSEVAHGDSSTAADDFNNVTYQQIENNNEQHKKVLGCGGYVMENHNWDEGQEEETAATCTTPANTKHVCADCDYVWNEETGSARGHTYAQTAAEWNDDHSKCTFTLTCSVCAAETEGHTKTVEATGVPTRTKDPTCEEVGSDKYTATVTSDGVTCTAEDTVEVAKVAHQFGQWNEEVPATCKATGTKGYKQCSSCKKNYDANGVVIDNLVIPTDANGHSFGQWHEEVPVKCTEDGIKAYKECTLCHNNFDANDEKLESLVIAHQGHIWENTYQYDTTNHWIKCQNCDAAEESTTAQHSLTWKVTESGEQCYQECETCGYKTDAAAHNYGAAYVDDTENNGHYQVCANCQHHSTTVSHTYPDGTTCDNNTALCVLCKHQKAAGEHNTAGVEWQSDGTKHWKECGTCHKHVDEANCSGGTATCTAKAVCATCGKEYGNIDSNNHDFTKQDTAEKYLASPASCTAKAQYYYSCTRCGEKDTVTFEYGNLLPHTYNKEEATENYLKTPATCTTQAVYYKSCECGEKGTATFKYGDLLPHTYDQEVATENYLKSAATCTAKAVYYKSCECGAVDKSETAATFVYGEMLPHRLTRTAAKVPTCTIPGNIEYWRCSGCGKCFSDAAGATEIAKGLDGTVIDATGHNMTEIPAVDATCTTDGNNKYYHCDRCNEYFKDNEGATKTTVAAETLPKLGHDFTEKAVDLDHRKSPATCQHAAVYCYDCSRCAEMSDTDTFAYGSTTAHNYGQDGKCPVCGAVNPMKDVDTDSIAAATEVGGKTVAVEEGKQIVADDSGLAVKTDSGVALNDVKEAVAAGNTVVTFDNNVNTTIPDDVTDGGKAALEELKKVSGVTPEQKDELDKIVVELDSYNSQSNKQKVKVEQVVDVSLELVKVNSNETLGEVKNVAQPIEIRIPASQSLINAFNSSNKVVKAIISHTEVNGEVTSKEVDVTYDESTGEAVIRMDAFSTVAFVTYENVGGGSHSSGSSAPTGARTITTDLPVGSINAVFVNGKKLDSKYYVINGSSVTLTEAYMSTLKAGRYTIRIENATHMSTATIEVAADGVLSARTGDMGLGMWYAMLTVSALLAVALVVKKRREA